jgi:signal transduction histidine kinase
LNAESEARPAESKRPQSEATPARNLAAALRAAASSAVQAVGGGVALVFTSRAGAPTGRSAQLRAAAGFARAEDAREAARALLPQVCESLDAGSERQLDPIPSLGDRSAGATSIHPLAFEDRVHGALVVGSPSALDSSERGALANLIAAVALRLDHARLEEELAALRSGGADKDEEPSEKSEEVLKLSEALFAQDIELLRTNEKLAKIEKLKNDFIEKMSRELRTPLNSIIEAIISVLTAEDETLSDGAKTSLRSALDDGSAFLRTLQNILDLWRIKQGEFPVEIQDVNFRELVDEAIFGVQDSIGDRPIRVEAQIEEPFPKLRMDLTKVNQILLLLLDNAARFTPRGRIEISARVVEDRLVCEVRDTGIGICPDDQQFVFDEFFQVDDSSSQKYRGAGLGLALVRDLVVLLEGEISISSEVGVGTALIFQIPVQVIT